MRKRRAAFGPFRIGLVVLMVALASCTVPVPQRVTAAPATKPATPPEAAPVSLVLLGHQDHGKTTLASAITKVLSKQGKAKYQTYDTLKAAVPDRERGVSLAKSSVEFGTNKRRYALADFATHKDI